MEEPFNQKNKYCPSYEKRKRPTENDDEEDGTLEFIGVNKKKETKLLTLTEEDLPKEEDKEDDLLKEKRTDPKYDPWEDHYNYAL